MYNLQLSYSGLTMERKNKNYDSQWADNYGV